MSDIYAVAHPWRSIAEKAAWTLCVAVTVMVAACGGSSETGAADPIIFSVRESQSFTTEGRYLSPSGGIGVSFEAGHYFVTKPPNPTRQLVQRATNYNYSPQAGYPWTNFVLSDGTDFMIWVSGAYSEPVLRYLHTNLANWSGGTTAFGIATKPENVPRQGTFAYSGFLAGGSEETVVFQGDWCCEAFPGWIGGAVDLTFDFSSGSATITVQPSLDLEYRYALPAISRAELVWSLGNPSFHQTDAKLQGADHPISGVFTGPSAEELIGGIRLEYLSPIDGSRKSAVAAFIAKRN